METIETPGQTIARLVPIVLCARVIFSRDCKNFVQNALKNTESMKNINKSEIVPNKTENIKGNRKWSNSETEKLIGEYEQKSCLWDLILLRRVSQVH
jgi:hypothetical protein